MRCKIQSYLFLLLMAAIASCAAPSSKTKAEVPWFWCERWGSGCIEFESDTFDFGKRPAHKAINLEIPFHNAGSKDLVIDGILPAGWDDKAWMDTNVYAPGQGGTLHVLLHSRPAGIQKLMFAIHSNGLPNLRHLLLRGELMDLPVIQFKETMIDFGRIAAGPMIRHRFAFKNIGSADLIIEDVKSSATNVIGNWSKTPVPPDSVGWVEMEMLTMGMEGVFRKSIAVITNGEPKSWLLHFKGEISRLD